MTVLEILGEAFVVFLNIGLVLGAVMGVLLLLRPVTNRLLAPRRRVVLWGAGWVMGWMAMFTKVFSFPPLPFPTLPDLLISRAYPWDGRSSVPVETGISDTYNVEIKSGVEEGAVVFTQVQTESSWM